MRPVHKAAAAALDRKAAAPLEPIAHDPALADAVAGYETVRVSVEHYNTAVKAANAAIEARGAAAAAADLKVAEAELARLRAVKVRHEPAMAGACERYVTLNKAKDDIEQAKKEIRTKLDEHTKQVIEPYEASINEYLERFNAGFRIAHTKHVYFGGQVFSTYQIVINKTAVDLGDPKTPAEKPRFGNTLSAGDRSTLALAFFLAHLHHDPQCADRIVWCSMIPSPARMRSDGSGRCTRLSGPVPPARRSSCSRTTPGFCAKFGKRARPTSAQHCSWPIRASTARRSSPSISTTPARAGPDRLSGERCREAARHDQEDPDRPGDVLQGDLPRPLHG